MEQFDYYSLDFLDPTTTHRLSSTFGLVGTVGMKKSLTAVKLSLRARHTIQRKMIFYGANGTRGDYNCVLIF
jgi:hypothetical protein